MYALTIWQPWANAVASGVKDVENRTWRPWAQVMGQRIAIHAGKRVDPNYGAGDRWVDAYMAERHFYPTTRQWYLEHCTGMIVGTAVVRGWWHEDGYGDGDDYQLAGTSDWFMGPYGWLFDNATPLRHPVPCRGAWGLWKVPPDVEEKVRRGS